MWVHDVEPETKTHSKQWIWAGSPPRKKFKLFLAGKVVLAAFWDSRGITLAYFMSKGQTITAKYYSGVSLEKKKHRNAERVTSNASTEKITSFIITPHPPSIPPHLLWK